MKKLSIILGLSLLGILFCLLFLDPNKLMPLQFLPIILLVYIFSVASIAMFLKVFIDTQSNQKVVFISGVLGLCPTILFSLMTLGAIAAIDVVLAVLVPSLIAWYGLRIKKF